MTVPTIARRSTVSPAQKPKTSAKGLETRDRIIDVAVRFIARNGARGTSLADIAAEAGVSQTGLLYHFRSKEALLNAVMDRHLAFSEEWLWGDGPDPGIKIVDIIAKHMASWPSQHDGKVASLLGMNTVVLGENVSPDTDLHPRLVDGYRTTIDRVTATLRSAQQRGEMREDIDPQLKAMEIIAFCYGLEAAWLVDPTIPVAAAAAQWAAQQTRQLATGSATS
ncbi:TetR/AcrR family transcriptional regulator [Dactylosporangium sp. AC04546]|uniref:TetR/AcrR family transcriptional regulator n=1 Tax=Dactylosporangium sp. AC04546 TaxID=2862460 RepID=UPI001EE037CA|nr:TetR/AcrR family transcriptional regulator [Dactylosporangium sp. AC04546]WVK86617.1 TetR/AcrR family transcriptional regulator [Dactylosporangium sp. AC04546]